MRKQYGNRLGVAMVVALALLAGPAVEAAVTVSNVSAAQTPETKQVVICYDVACTETNAVSISLVVSNGAAAVACPSVSGHVGPGVPTGAGRSMVWNMAADWNGNFSTNLRAYVTAVGGASALLWTPTSLPGLAVWLDAADASTLWADTNATVNVTNNGTVARWSDKSGFGRHTYQTDATRRPKYTGAFLDYANDSLAGEWATTNNQQIVAFVGALSSASQTGARLFTQSDENTDTTYPRYVPLFRSASEIYSYLAGGSRLGTSFTYGQTNIWIATFNGASVNMSYNGTLTTEYPFEYSQVNTRFSVGGYLDESLAASIVGTVCEVVVGTASLTTFDCLNIEGYLAHKWGLANRLPCGHPFKNEPPESTPHIVAVSPMPRAIYQRGNLDTAAIPITGIWQSSFVRAEARAVVKQGYSGVDTGWQSMATQCVSDVFSGTLSVTAGGWYDVELRVFDGLAYSAVTTVEKVGVGDVYITAGQSNAGNNGSPEYTPTNDIVSAWNGDVWRHAYDPQPIATSGFGKGSPWSRLGDLLVAKESVPIGFVSVAVGGTRIDQWVPGSNYYSRIQDAITDMGATGFRAILWHQGESDSAAGTTTSNYVARLQSIIAQSRVDAGWDVPWGVALASYYPGASTNDQAQVRAAQLEVIAAAPLVFQGSDTDEYHNLGYLIDTVHFNEAGLYQHAIDWKSAISLWENLYD